MLKSGVVLCFHLGVFSEFSHSLSYEGQLRRNASFDNVLPSHTLYYTKFFDSIPRTQCALECLLIKSACAGILYNNKLLSCKLIKCYLNERFIDRTHVHLGWEFWSLNNVCPSGWVPFGNHCYFLSKTKLNWNIAKGECALNGAHLVQIETRAENTWIMEVFLSPWVDADCYGWWNCCDCWIGATDLDSEGVFTWNHHGIIKFSNWYPGQPDNFNMGHCVRVCRNGYWDDVDCNDQYELICEKE